MLKTNLELFLGAAITKKTDFSRYIYLEIDGDRLGLKVKEYHYKLSEDRELLGLKDVVTTIDEESIDPKDIEQTIMDLIPSGTYYNVQEVNEVVSIVKHHFSEFNDYHYVIK